MYFVVRAISFSQISNAFHLRGQSMALLRISGHFHYQQYLSQPANLDRLAFLQVVTIEALSISPSISTSVISSQSALLPATSYTHYIDIMNYERWTNGAAMRNYDDHPPNLEFIAELRAKILPASPSIIVVQEPEKYVGIAYFFKPQPKFDFASSVTVTLLGGKAA